MGRLCPIDSLVSHVCCVKLTCTRTRVFRLFSSVCLFLPPLRKKGKRGPDCAGAVCRHGRRRRRHRWRRGRIRRLLGPLERDGLKRLSPLQSPARAGMGVSALLPRRPYWVVLGRRLDRIDSRVPSCVASTLPADARSFLNGLSAWAKKSARLSTLFFHQLDFAQKQMASFAWHVRPRVSIARLYLVLSKAPRSLPR